MFAMVSCLGKWPEDMLKLSVDVHCQWRPGVPVNPCDKCQQRERRRVESTFPLEGSSVDDHQSTSDNEPPRDSHSMSMSQGESRAAPHSEDVSSIVVFRNAPWEVKNNNVIVRLRVTCYSSHHNEDKGFEYAN